jgi:hypothetical protein
MSETLRSPARPHRAQRHAVVDALSSPCPEGLSATGAGHQVAIAKIVLIISESSFSTGYALRGAGVPESVALRSRCLNEADVDYSTL